MKADERTRCLTSETLTATFPSCLLAGNSSHLLQASYTFFPLSSKPTVMGNIRYALNFLYHISLTSANFKDSCDRSSLFSTLFPVPIKLVIQIFQSWPCVSSLKSVHTCCNLPTGIINPVGFPVLGFLLYLSNCASHLLKKSLAIFHANTVPCFINLFFFALSLLYYLIDPQLTLMFCLAYYVITVKVNP